MSNTTLHLDMLISRYNLQNYLICKGYKDFEICAFFLNWNILFVSTLMIVYSNDIELSKSNWLVVQEKKGRDLTRPHILSKSRALSNFVGITFFLPYINCN